MRWKYWKYIFQTLEAIFPFFTKVVKANIIAFIKTKILRPVLSVTNPPFQKCQPLLHSALNSCRDRSHYTTHFRRQHGPLHIARHFAHSHHLYMRHFSLWRGGKADSKKWEKSFCHSKESGEKDSSKGQMRAKQSVERMKQHWQCNFATWNGCSKLTQM